MKMTVKEMLTVNHRRFHEFLNSLRFMDKQEIETLINWYEQEDKRQKESPALIDKVLPYTWLALYARCARHELALRSAI